MGRNGAFAPVMDHYTERSPRFFVPRRFLLTRPLRADAARNRARVLEVAYDTFASDGLSVPIDEIGYRRLEPLEIVPGGVEEFGLRCGRRLYGCSLRGRGFLLTTLGSRPRSS